MFESVKYFTTWRKNILLVGNIGAIHKRFFETYFVNANKYYTISKDTIGNLSEYTFPNISYIITTNDCRFEPLEAERVFSELGKNYFAVYIVVQLEKNASMALSRES